MRDGRLLLQCRVHASLAHGPGHGQSQETQNRDKTIPVRRPGNVLKHAAVFLPAPTSSTTIVDRAPADVNARRPCRANLLQNDLPGDLLSQDIADLTSFLGTGPLLLLVADRPGVSLLPLLLYPI